MTYSRFPQKSIESEEEPSINLMPLIDVVFVVLVMFIVIAPMVQIDRIELAQGEGVAYEKNAKQILKITITSKNGYKLNQREVSLTELQMLLKEAYKRSPQQIPQIMPDKNASFQAYEHVRSAVKSAGYESIDVTLSP